ncbi:MAG: TIGR03619 family F420-dependent LLM class oxidoreductase [Chloroflexi bacterium]|nr:TIGR03619 family F420-dependent LLM class oxidoreductase [Chloroflexota bacterium]
MKFGLKLSHSGPGASPETMLRWTQFAETLGLHLIMTADHVALTPEVLRSYPAPYYEAFTNIAWLAAQTRKIKFGTTVIVIPYRHPIHLAHLTANVDQLSGGRLILGVGVGWARTEYESLGVPFNKRGAIANDYLAALKLLWTQDVATYEGPFVSFKEVMVSPKPLQKPHPPIWVGGDHRDNSEPGMRRAVRFGNAWHPLGATVDSLRDKSLPLLRRIAEEEGKAVPALCPRIYCRITDSPLDEDQRVAGEGTLDQIHSDLAALEGMGAEYVVFDTKRRNPTAASDRHHEDAWRVLTTLAEKVIDLEKETVR